jgi:hypothetical protein
MDSLLNILGADQYRPRSVCLANDFMIMMLYATADVVLFFSTLTIACILYYYRNASFQLSPRVRILASMFMAVFAFSMLSRAMNIPFAMYRLDVILLACLSGIAVATAWSIYFAIYSQVKRN